MVSDTDTFILPFVQSAFLFAMATNIYNGYRTNAAAEASYDRAGSLPL